MNTKITALVLAYNEESRIGDVIRSLKGFDKIIVHDKSSTDNTVQIAEELGVRVFKTPYYNDTVPVPVLKQLKKMAMEEQPNEWILSLTSSDIIHHKLLLELQRAIELNADCCDVIEVPMYRYSMGVVGKNTYYGGIENKPVLIRRNALSTAETMVHESPYANMNKFRMECTDPKVAIYHLTHPDLDLIMDRHWRYAIQYVEDAVSKGRDRKDVMKYAVNECIRTVYRYFRNGIYKSKDTGKAQLMMLLMYNCMIFLNAFFDKAKEQEIQSIYEEIKSECGKDE